MAAAHAPPRILFRADARPDLGGGHIMRCLSLASALAERGAEIAFASTPGTADIAPALARSRFETLSADRPSHTPMPASWGGQADAIFVDLYDSSLEDETAMRSHCRAIAVIEDLPDRPHDCDVLVDQGLARTPSDYAGRVAPDTQLLLGPHMVPLRPEFAAQRADSLRRKRQISTGGHILIAMGLTDLGGISARVAKLVRECLPDAQIEVVLGPSAPSLAELKRRSEDDARLDVLVDIDNMAAHMANADLAIGAGGGTALERCVLGLPSIIIILADNQRHSAVLLGQSGAGWILDADQSLDTALPERLAQLDPMTLNAASQAAAGICDGAGAGRIADALLQIVAARR